MTAERGQREADSSLASGVGDMRLKTVLGNPTEGAGKKPEAVIGGLTLREAWEAFKRGFTREDAEAADMRQLFRRMDACIGALKEQGMVYVCPTKDIVCGTRPENWCASCPLTHATAMTQERFNEKMDALDRENPVPLLRETLAYLLGAFRASLSAKPVRDADEIIANVERALLASAPTRPNPLTTFDGGREYVLPQPVPAASETPPEASEPDKQEWTAISQQKGTA